MVTCVQQDHIGDLHVIFFGLFAWVDELRRITEFTQKSISGCNPLEPKVPRGATGRKNNGFRFKTKKNSLRLSLNMNRFLK